MAIKKCPECGGKVSSTLDVCPHCGYSLEKKTSKRISSSVEDKDIVICNRDKFGKGATYFLMFVGIFLVVAIIGIIILIICFSSIKQIDENNGCSKQNAYYNRKTKQVSLFSYKGATYTLDMDDIKNANFKYRNHELLYNNCEIGIVAKGEYNMFLDKIEQIKNGTF